MCLHALAHAKHLPCLPSVLRCIASWTPGGIRACQHMLLALHDTAQHNSYHRCKHPAPELHCLLKGIGKKLWQSCVQAGLEMKCTRCNFSVLDWNKPSIEFYKSKGAVDLSGAEGWLAFRLHKPEMEKFVKEWIKNDVKHFQTCWNNYFKKISFDITNPQNSVFPSKFRKIHQPCFGAFIKIKKSGFRWAKVYLSKYIEYLRIQSN